MKVEVGDKLIVDYQGDKTTYLVTKVENGRVYDRIIDSTNRYKIGYSMNQSYKKYLFYIKKRDTGRRG